MEFQRIISEFQRVYKGVFRSFKGFQFRYSTSEEITGGSLRHLECYKGFQARFRCVTELHGFFLLTWVLTLCLFYT